MANRLNYLEQQLKQFGKTQDTVLSDLKNGLEANIGLRVKQDREYQQNMTIFQRLERLEEIFDSKFPDSGTVSRSTNIRSMVNK